MARSAHRLAATRLVASTLVASVIAVCPAKAQTSPPAPSTPSLLGAPVPVVKPPPDAKPHRHHVPATKAKPAAAKPPAKSVTQPVAAARPPIPPTPAPPPVVAEAPAAPPKLDPTKGSATGLKVPRWVAFRSDEVNVRTGPGMNYPILWQYHRRDLPVVVLREYDAWRLVQMQDRDKGWVNQATLTGRRGFLIVEQDRVMRASPDEAAAPVARLQTGVVGRIRSCEAAKPWCEVQTGEYKGWLRRSDVWGLDPDEAID